RSPFPGTGDPDRPANGRQVSRPARHSPGPHAEARMTLAAAETVDVSVLVPAKDEASNLPEFVRLCAEALDSAPFTYEVVIVNDGSRDESAGVLRELARTHPFLRVVTHRRQLGIAEALRSAGDVARGDVFVFYPADLQYLPADIPALVAP